MQLTTRTLLGIAVATGAAAGLLFRKNVPPRQRVADIARSQLGSTDNAKYWASALPGQNPAGLSWCGAFTLWALHEAGLALDTIWKLGVGFVSGKLPLTKNPEIGDIAYFTANQHYAVVLNVDPIARTVELANGNGTGGKVTRSVVPFSSAAGFYSIAPLVGV